MQKNATKTLEHKAKILDFMSDKVWVKASEINEAIDISSRRLREILTGMVLDGDIEEDGKTKGKRYRIKDGEISNLADTSV